MAWGRSKGSHVSTSMLTVGHTFVGDLVARLASLRWQVQEHLGSLYETELHVADGKVFSCDAHEASELCTSDVELSKVDGLWGSGCPLIAFTWYRATSADVCCAKRPCRNSCFALHQPELTSGKAKTLHDPVSRGFIGCVRQ